MFPSKDALPENITFHHQNLLLPFPDEYLGKFDVVNVRVMVVALSSHEWEPAVRNMMTLLSAKSPSSGPTYLTFFYLTMNRTRRPFAMGRLRRT